MHNSEKATPWTACRIEECLSGCFPGEWGSAPKGEGNATVLRATDIDDDGHIILPGVPRQIPAEKLSWKKLVPGDILLEASGGGPGKPVGRVALFNTVSHSAFVCSNFFRTLRPDASKVYPAFLIARLLHLHSTPQIWHFQQQTTGIINLKLQDYLRATILLPPRDEQQEIGNILEAVDKSIRRTEQIVDKLKLVRQGLLHCLLTLGVNDNGEPRDPLRNPEQFKESAIGNIPKPWNLSRLNGLVIGIDSGVSPDCPDRPAVGNEWGVLKVSAVRPSGFQNVENKAILNPVHINPDLEVKDGDLLITRANTSDLVGLTCLVREPRPRLLLCDKTLRLKVAKTTDRRFLFYAMQMPHVRRQIECHATGSSASMKNISQVAIRSLQILLAPLGEQALIAERIGSCDAQLSNEILSLAKLRELRKGLSTDLLTGHVRVTPLLEKDSTP